MLLFYGQLLSAFYFLLYLWWLVLTIVIFSFPVARSYTLFCGIFRVSAHCLVMFSNSLILFSVISILITSVVYNDVSFGSVIFENCYKSNIPSISLDQSIFTISLSWCFLICFKKCLFFDLSMVFISFSIIWFSSFLIFNPIGSIQLFFS